MRAPPDAQHPEPQARGAQTELATADRREGTAAAAWISRRRGGRQLQELEAQLDDAAAWARVVAQYLHIAWAHFEPGFDLTRDDEILWHVARMAERAHHYAERALESLQAALDAA